MAQARIQEKASKLAQRDFDLSHLADEIANTVKEEANTRVVFGEPIQLETHAIIPVARVKVNAGGGGALSRGLASLFKLGRSAEPKAEGGDGEGEASALGAGGLGLEIDVEPLGFIAESDGKVTYSPLEHHATPFEALGALLGGRKKASS